MKPGRAANDSDSDDEAKSRPATLSERFRARRTQDPSDGVSPYRIEEHESTTHATFTPARTYGVQLGTPVVWAADGNQYIFVSGAHTIVVNRLLPPGSTAGVSAVSKLLNGHTGRVSALLVHPTEPLLVSAGEDGIFLWDLVGGKLLQKIGNTGKRAHEASVECLCWCSAAQALISGSRDTSFILWRFTLRPAAGAGAGSGSSGSGAAGAAPIATPALAGGETSGAGAGSGGSAEPAATASSARIDFLEQVLSHKVGPARPHYTSVSPPFVAPAPVTLPLSLLLGSHASLSSHPFLTLAVSFRVPC